MLIFSVMLSSGKVIVPIFVYVQKCQVVVKKPRLMKMVSSKEKVYPAIQPSLNITRELILGVKAVESRLFILLAKLRFLSH